MNHLRSSCAFFSIGRMPAQGSSATRRGDIQRAKFAL
jgi:hypothetical protein